MTVMPTDPFVRIPPQNIESEKALLGSIMLRPEAMHDVSDIVLPESFYDRRHRTVYEIMLELHAKKEPIDLLSLTSRLKERKLLDDVGGRVYLTELVHGVPASTNVKYYAEMVQKKSILRNLIAASDFIGELGYDEESEIEELLDDAEKRIFSVTGSSVGSSFIKLKDSLEEAWERLDMLHKSGAKMRGVPTGFKQLDRQLSGLQKSDLVILAARPSMGKTSLALDIARHAALEHNIPVGIFSLETSAQQLVDRMFAAESRIDAWKLRTGDVKTDDEFQRLQDSMARLSKAPIFIDDMAGNGLLQMRSAARKLKREQGLGLLVVDYLQLITTPRRYESMVQQVTEISRSLKSLARELDVPVLALSQLSRAVEQRQGEPRLSDLRDSGSIEQDADVVMFIHRKDKQQKNAENEKTNVADILIEKHRNGPTGRLELYFDEKRSTFLNLEKDDVYNAAANVPTYDPFKEDKGKDEDF
ncbi:MAG TPA: replicative DNA helicase [Candidatus Paceibacterota bacterium]